MCRRPSTNQLTLDVVLLFSSILVNYNILKLQNKQTKLLKPELRCFIETTSYTGLTGLTCQKRMWKQDCPPCRPHNQLEPVTILNHIHHQHCVVVFIVAQTLRDFKTITILVYIILNSNGGGSNWLWLHGDSLVPDLFFIRSIQSSWLFINTSLLLVLCDYC